MEKENQFVCPLPQIWNEIHQNLILAYKKENLTSKPPIPLILNGWMFSSEKEKFLRWKETFEWVSKNGLSNLLPDLNESQSYFGSPNDTFNYGNDFV